MTPGSCYKKAAAYKFFALFNGTRCYAGNDLAPSLRHGRGAKGGCTIPCGSSSSKQTCGGSAAFMVYVNHAPKVPAQGAASKPAGKLPPPAKVPSRVVGAAPDAPAIAA
jgi:hypothetical protein